MSQINVDGVRESHFVHRFLLKWTNVWMNEQYEWMKYLSKHLHMTLVWYDVIFNSFMTEAVII